tara:strand:+ start:381 stop:1043 length:663 start_codon:yes stop_codon:yes gene_type:complete
MMEIPVIAIDGDASSGKTSISKMLSKKLGFYFLDSGILYRTMGYIKLNKNINFSSLQNTTNILEKISLVPDVEKYFRVNLDNIDITDKLYTEDIGQQASIVSQYPSVREALLLLQHSCVTDPGLVANGRDMGTKVFPDAILKIFMTASIEVRAERRYKELIATGLEVNLIDIQNKIVERDNSDKNRDISPLKLASDAHIIDSTNLNLETILDKILELYNI